MDRTPYPAPQIMAEPRPKCFCAAQSKFRGVPKNRFSNLNNYQPSTNTQKITTTNQCFFFGEEKNKRGGGEIFIKNLRPPRPISRGGKGGGGRAPFSINPKNFHQKGR